MEILKKIKTFPRSPGVYLMKDKNNKVIYVGKAKNLHNRVSSYFSNSFTDPKTSILVNNIFDIDFIVTENEIEALILEDTLIKQHLPKYNILLKDDKRYPFLKLTINEEYPRLIIVRRRAKDNALYFGPYTSVKSMRETLKLINRIFPIRKCNKKLKLERSIPPYFKPVGNYCLYYQMKQCLAPCQGNVDPQEYKRIIKQISLFLQGKNHDLIQELNLRMQEYTKKLEFEKAAKIRDRLLAIEKVMEKQKIISSKFESKDVIAFSYKGEIYNITLLFIREGKMVGKNNFVIEKKFKEMTTDEIITSFIKQYYSNPSFLPEEVLLSIQIEDAELIEQWLFNITGQKINIKIAKTEFENRLLKMAYENSVIELSNYLMDIEMRESKKRLIQLQKVLNLKRLPTEIEAFDISNISGKFAVGSMVKFINAQPAKNEYRQFKIKTVDGIDDFKMMEEVVFRRYKRIKDENKNLPDLILIDGGKGQLTAALSALHKNEIYNIPIIALAKREELIFIPGKSEPLKLNRNSSALKLLQNIRDEAHRFAIEFHKRLRKKELVHSQLDDIPGIGEKLKSRLLKTFGSIESIVTAPVEELLKIPGITRNIVNKIKELRSQIE